MTGQPISEFIEEGAVKIQKEPVNPLKKDEGGHGTLFYNPAQVVNRDLSVLVLLAYGKRRLKEQQQSGVADSNGLVMSEPLAATGLRSLRYAKELPKGIVARIVASDIDKSAVESISKNCLVNGIPDGLIDVYCADANEILSCAKYILKDYNNNPSRTAFDVVDLDPFGSSVRFLDSAIQSLKDGGLLCATCTDMTVLGGNCPEIAFYKYGGTTVKTPYIHELSVRLVLHQIQMTAAKYRKFIEPVLSLSLDFYVRVFVRVFNTPILCSSIVSNTAVVLQCSNCRHFTVVPFGRTNDKHKLCDDREPSNRPSKRQRIKEHRTATAEGEKLEAVAKTEEEEEAQSSTTGSSAESVTLGTVSQGMSASDSPSSGEGSSSASAAPSTVCLFNGKFSCGRASNGRLSVCLSSSGHSVEGCCNECHTGHMKMAGPFYAGPLHDFTFVQECLDELNGSRDEDVSEYRLSYPLKMKDRIKGALSACLEELPDVPLFYTLESLCTQFRTNMIKLVRIKSALLNAGYRVGLFHRIPTSIKTDAPNWAVFDIIQKCWVDSVSKSSSSETAALHTDAVVRNLRSRVLKLEKIDFTFNNTSLHSKVCPPKWLPNHRHWGPGTKAKKAKSVSDEREAGVMSG